MILPGSLLFSLILLILSLVCWGSWANTLKMAGPKWRFELYCYDFAVGALLAALLISFTLGTFGLDGFTTMDDLRLAGKRQDAFAFLGGCIFTLGNFLTIGAISLAGMSVALPVSLGVAMIVGTGVGWVLHRPTGGGMLLIAGAAAVLAAVVLAGMACKRYLAAKTAAQVAAAAQASQEAALQAKPGTLLKKKGPRRKPASGKALLMAVLAGILLAFFPTLLDAAREGENGLGPYSTALIFTAGLAFSSFVYNLFFMNLPVQGAPVEFGQYFAGKAGDHLQGLAGGAIWLVGLVSIMVAARAEGVAHPGPAFVYAAAQAPAVIGALWGLVAWNEFSGAESTTRIYVWLMLLLLAVGVGVASMAPLYAR
jgi:glucose uptake protein